MGVERGALRIITRRAVRGVAHRQSQDIRQVQGPAFGQLRDLFPAAEAVGHDQRVARGAADGREQDAFTDGNRHIVVLRLEAEGAGHPAAAAFRRVALQTQALE